MRDQDELDWLTVTSFLLAMAAAGIVVGVLAAHL